MCTVWQILSYYVSAAVSRDQNELPSNKASLRVVVKSLLVTQPGL